MTLYIHGMGHFHPEPVITNKFLEELDIGTNDDWIVERVGIRERRSALPLDYLRQTETGEIAVDLGRVSRDQAAGIVALRVIERIGARGDRVRDVSIRLGEKRAALVDIARHLGLFADTGAGPHDHMNEGQLEQYIADVLRQNAEMKAARDRVSVRFAQPALPAPRVDASESDAPHPAAAPASPPPFTGEG